jgi:hypothetical protein
MYKYTTMHRATTTEEVFHDLVKEQKEVAADLESAQDVESSQPSRGQGHARRPARCTPSSLPTHHIVVRAEVNYGGGVVAI